MKRITLSYNGLEYSAIEIEAYKIDTDVTEEQLIEYFKKLDL